MGQIRSFVGKLSKTYTDSFSNINQVICHMKRASEAQQYMSALVSKVLEATLSCLASACTDVTREPEPDWGLGHCNSCQAAASMYWCPSDGRTGSAARQNYCMCEEMP